MRPVTYAVTFQAPAGSERGKVSTFLKAALRQRGLVCIDVRQTTAERLEWEQRASGDGNATAGNSRKANP